jgi:hypothetical protein
MPTRRLLDLGSNLTLVVTLVLFAVALFVTGLSHDLLLEAGVFLVSVKLVIAGRKQELVAEEMRAELREIHRLLTPEQRPN